MNHIESLYIIGFKKFSEIQIDFNEQMNILVGENESGKSTVFNAIKIVLNQQYRNADKSVLKELLNLQMVEQFLANPELSNLPYIRIEIVLNLNPKTKNAEFFYGENNSSKNELFGITFECKFNEELGSGLVKEIEAGKIPYEYYDSSDYTFTSRFFMQQ